MPTNRVGRESQEKRFLLEEAVARAFSEKNRPARDLPDIRANDFLVGISYYYYIFFLFFF